MTRLEQRIAEVAEATGTIVAIGRQGHKDEWFATGGGEEVAAGSASAALEDLVKLLKRKAHATAAEAQASVRRAEALQKL